MNNAFALPLRAFTAMIASFLLTQICHALIPNPVTACAIRWDAWYSNGPTDPARYTAATLSPPQFHSLAPLHAKFDSAGNITWDASQTTFDNEIRMANAAGLCWAYLMYGKNNIIDLNHPMMKALSLHRSSSLKSSVHYAMMIPSSLIGTTAAFGASTDAAVTLMADSNYQHVMIGNIERPLIFIFYNALDLRKYFGGSMPNMRQSIDAIRSDSATHGMTNPYLVIVLGNPKDGETVRIGLGADAISEYTAGRRTKGAMNWKTFEPTIEADWDSFADATSADAIPTLRSGADIRARCETPPPFEHRFPPGFDCSHFYVDNPTLIELQYEFHASVAWINSHPLKDRARMILIYAWSECDESGNCLMPTYGDPDGNKLKAVSLALH